MAAPTALDLEAVTRRFGTRTVVDRLSFSVGRGAVFGFLGPNGAGKTTLSATGSAFSPRNAACTRA